jgi:hypothetical protein
MSFWRGPGHFAVPGCAACLLALTPASAQKADFGVDPAFRAPAADKQFCQIVVSQNGTLFQNVGSTKLSSLINPGMPGLADVTTSNGSYYVSVDRPSGFSIAPQGGSDDVEFSTQFTAHGATNFGLSPGDSRMKLKNGLTNVEVHLEARKLRGAFRAGHYKATVILRCE